jgi:hypothetical protein
MSLRSLFLHFCDTHHGEGRLRKYFKQAHVEPDGCHRHPCGALLAKGSNNAGISENPEFYLAFPLPRIVIADENRMSRFRRSATGKFD